MDYPMIVCIKHGLRQCPDCPPSVIPQVHINRKYDVPYVAGYSSDGNVVYIDRKLPRKFHTTTEKLVMVDQYLILHEVVEKSLMDRMGCGYNEAHILALGAELAALSRDGVPPDEYYGFIWGWFDETRQIENIHRTPPDLDLSCYREDKQTAIIERLRELGHNQLTAESK